jgi:hypothetical protein
MPPGTKHWQSSAKEKKKTAGVTSERVSVSAAVAFAFPPGRSRGCEPTCSDEIPPGVSAASMTSISLKSRLDMFELRAIHEVVREEEQAREEVGTQEFLEIPHMGSTV